MHLLSCQYTFNTLVLVLMHALMPTHVYLCQHTCSTHLWQHTCTCANTRVLVPTHLFSFQYIVNSLAHVSTLVIHLLSYQFLSIRLSIQLSIQLSIRLFWCHFLSIHLSMHLLSGKLHEFCKSFDCSSRYFTTGLFVWNKYRNKNFALTNFSKQSFFTYSPTHAPDFWFPSLTFYTQLFDFSVRL